MIKVLKHGILSNSYYQKKCPNCNCFFEYQEDDIQILESNAIGYDYYALICPECHYYIKSWDRTDFIK